MKKHLSEIRIVRDPDSKTGLSAIVLLRGIAVKGPYARGEYRIVRRTVRGKYGVPCGTQKRKPVAKIEITCPANKNEWKAIMHNTRLERARAQSPMLK